MTKIVFLDPTSDDRLSRMRQLMPQGWILTNATSRSQPDQLDALEGATFAIASDVPVTQAMLAVPGLRAVHKWGVGYDAFDLDAARLNNVRILRTTGSNAIAVAETTLGLILAVNRNLVRGHVSMSQGKWIKSELGASTTLLSGKTVGIVGMGYIGQAVARLLTGFGCRLIYTKRNALPADQEAALGIQYASLEELLAQSDVVTLNCELNDSTRNMIDRRTLAMMKPDAILINVARGGVVVEADLAEAIRAGHLRGAGVDVFAVEPIRPDNPLLGLDGVVLTPHVAALDTGGFASGVMRMVQNLLAVQNGTPPRDIDVII